MNFNNIFLGHCRNLLTSCINIQQTSVRHIYWADKIAKGRMIKNFGYEDGVSRTGILPRLDNVDKLPMPDYRPKNAWSRKRALFGQNDYIDLLGNGRLHPTTVSYETPAWLRGVHGSEMQLLIRKSKIFGIGPYQHLHPTSWSNLHKRIRHLYKVLNRKTKTGLMRK